MKKILLALALLSFLAGMVVPAVALAQPIESCTLKHDLTKIDDLCGQDAIVSETVTKAWGLCCALDGVYTATDWIFVILMVVVSLLIIWGAFTIVTAGGAPEKVTTGRNYIIYALIGLAIAILAKALPSIVKGLIGA